MNVVSPRPPRLQIRRSPARVRRLRHAVCAEPGSLVREGARMSEGEWTPVWGAGSRLLALSSERRNVGKFCTVKFRIEIETSVRAGEQVRGVSHWTARRCPVHVRPLWGSSQQSGTSDVLEEMNSGTAGHSGGLVSVCSSDERAQPRRQAQNGVMHRGWRRYSAHMVACGSTKG